MLSSTESQSSSCRTTVPSPSPFLLLFPLPHSPSPCLPFQPVRSRELPYLCDSSLTSPCLLGSSPLSPLPLPLPHPHLTRSAADCTVGQSRTVRAPASAARTRRWMPSWLLPSIMEADERKTNRIQDVQGEQTPTIGAC